MGEGRTDKGGVGRRSGKREKVGSKRGVRRKGSGGEERKVGREERERSEGSKGRRKGGTEGGRK